MDAHNKLRMRMRQMQAQRGAVDLEASMRNQGDLCRPGVVGSESANAMISSLMNIQTCKGVGQRKKLVLEFFVTMKTMDPSIVKMIIQSLGTGQFTALLRQAVKTQDYQTYVFFIKIVKGIEQAERLIDDTKGRIPVASKLPVPTPGKKKKRRKRKCKNKKVKGSLLEVLADLAPPVESEPSTFDDLIQPVVYATPETRKPLTFMRLGDGAKKRKPLTAMRLSPHLVRTVNI
jgi:hypothetical protein